MVMKPIQLSSSSSWLLSSDVSFADIWLLVMSSSSVVLLSSSSSSSHRVLTRPSAASCIFFAVYDHSDHSSCGAELPCHCFRHCPCPCCVASDSPSMECLLVSSSR